MDATAILPYLFAGCLAAALALFWLGFRFTREERTLEQSIDTLQGGAVAPARTGPATPGQQTATQVSRG